MINNIRDDEVINKMSLQYRLNQVLDELKELG